MDLFKTNTQLFTSQDNNSCTGVTSDYCAFISCLAPIHCKESIGEQVMQFSKSVLMKKQTLRLG